jgi:hypothetical protein
MTLAPVTENAGQDRREHRHRRSANYERDQRILRVAVP